MFVEEIRLKSNSNLIPDKGVPSTPLSVFAVPFHKGKPQGRVGHGIDECAFWKEKGHWKAKCPKLLKENKKNFKSPSSNVVATAHTTIIFMILIIHIHLRLLLKYLILHSSSKSFLPLSHVSCMPPLLNVWTLLVYQVHLLPYKL